MLRTAPRGRGGKTGLCGCGQYKACTFSNVLVTQRVFLLGPRTMPRRAAPHRAGAPLTPAIRGPQSSPPCSRAWNSPLVTMPSSSTSMLFFIPSTCAHCGKIRTVDPNLGQLQVSNSDLHSNCWPNLKIQDQPCESQAVRSCLLFSDRGGAAQDPGRGTTPHGGSDSGAGGCAPMNRGFCAVFYSCPSDRSRG